ncbi:MAG: hypothetical protein DMF61_14300 [Blastocatellia bacterium AA13]|nr:MAG: hypothetical protein DMF61_14300 [Blastocatellia bacterium AA13]
MPRLCIFKIERSGSTTPAVNERDRLAIKTRENTAKAVPSERPRRRADDLRLFRINLTEIEHICIHSERSIGPTVRATPSLL